MGNTKTSEARKFSITKLIGGKYDIYDRRLSIRAFLRGVIGKSVRASRNYCETKKEAAIPIRTLNEFFESRTSREPH